MEGATSGFSRPPRLGAIRTLLCIPRLAGPRNSSGVDLHRQHMGEAPGPGAPCAEGGSLRVGYLTRSQVQEGFSKAGTFLYQKVTQVAVIAIGMRWLAGCESQPCRANFLRRNVAQLALCGAVNAADPTAPALPLPHQI